MKDWFKDLIQKQFNPIFQKGIISTIMIQLADMIL